MIVLLKKLKAFLRLTLGKRLVSNNTLLAKAVIYRFFSVIATFLITFAMTGNTQISLSISAFDLIGKTILYYIYDVAWNNVRKKL